MSTIRFIKAFEPKVVDSSGEDIYTVPATPTTTLLQGCVLRFHNTTTSTKTITVVTSVQCVKEKIAAESYEDIEISVLAAGDTINITPSAAASINVHFHKGYLIE